MIILNVHINYITRCTYKTSGDRCL